MNNLRPVIGKIVPLKITKPQVTQVNRSEQPEQPEQSNLSSHSRFSAEVAPSTQNITMLLEPLPIKQERSEVSPLAQQPGQEIVQPKALDRFLPSISQWVSIGGVIMIASLGAAIGLSTILKYKVTIQAPASIRPIGELRVVQSTIEGSVQSIAVRENQTVQLGEQLATVKDLRLESKLQTKRNQLTGDINKAKQQVSAIDTQIGAIDRQGIAEREQIARSISSIQTELGRADRDYREKGLTTQAEVAEAQANWRTAQREQQAATADIAVAAANLKSLQASYQSALTRSQRYKKAAKAGAISTDQLAEAELTTEQQVQSIAAQAATISKQQQIVARAAETVAATKARVERSQAALNPSHSDAQIIRQKIAREHANGQAAIARLQQERQKLLQQRVEIVNQIATNQQEIAQIAIDLRPTPILAPIAGTIQDLNLRNNAQVVQPGDRLAQIMPTGTLLNIKALVSIADIPSVKVGQTVQMRIAACPYSDYGMGTGKVVEIAADVKSEKPGGTAPQQPTGVYEVTIKPDRLSLTRGQKSCQMRSGMDGRADIISTEETVFQFILKKSRLFSL
jgi:multidrug efflux pump subunit AcrA (membrane-fusion protein)